MADYMENWEGQFIAWILFLCMLLHAMTGYSLFLLSDIVDENERRLEQLEQMHEQVEEIKDSA